MDRISGKTQDVFVEFFSEPDAKAWVSLINSRPRSMNKMGERVLDVEFSSQTELLKELFPRAKYVNWSGGYNGRQVVSELPVATLETGFKTFLTLEELQSLERHAEYPHRVSPMDFK